jgi:hypothetical protein
MLEWILQRSHMDFLTLLDLITSFKQIIKPQFQKISPSQLEVKIRFLLTVNRFQKRG